MLSLDQYLEYSKNTILSCSFLLCGCRTVMNVDNFVSRPRAKTDGQTF
jgi:hypothetical protein